MDGISSKSYPMTGIVLAALNRVRELLQQIHDLREGTK